ncbi:serum paraoxonase arylesterase 1 [Brachionus plicatilis]|uniref:Serum paraoxonase arylesterase 1 n=1 Tax=Brachionus plicatilis TaxID=10195 RepID=A0A3M7S838_BRAPC|nr:serum paraoxonase arylesterase 1 [Brachionus plicatilis]
MGYLSEHENSVNKLKNCNFTFKNLIQKYSHPIRNTVDSDRLPNGLTFVLSSFDHNFVHFPESMSTGQSSIYVLDLNYLYEPIRVEIVNHQYQLITEQFNLVCLSVYQDKKRNFNLIAGNYITEKRKEKFGLKRSGYSIEKFVYDSQKYSLIHEETFVNDQILAGLCDLVVVGEDQLYFSKCFSSPVFKSLKFNLAIGDGQIWFMNMAKKTLFLAADNLFIPKSIEYLDSENLIVVSNHQNQGISLFNREHDDSLSRKFDINLKSFVFNINKDSYDNLWISLHSFLYQTLSTDSGHLTENKLIKLKLDLKHSQHINHENEVFFSNNGSYLNGLGSVQIFKDNLILFSLDSDPLVCKI